MHKKGMLNAHNFHASISPIEILYENDAHVDGKKIDSCIYFIAQSEWFHSQNEECAACMAPHRFSASLCWQRDAFDRQFSVH